MKNGILSSFVALLVVAMVPLNARAVPFETLRLWSIVRPTGPPEDPGSIVSVNHDVLVKLKNQVRSDGAANVIVDLMHNESLVCTLRNFQGLLHPDLAAKFPRLVTLSGHCDDDLSTATLCFNEDNKKSLAVTMNHKGRELFFAEHDDKMSRDDKEFHLRVPRVSATNWTDTIIPQEIPEGRSHSLLRAGGRNTQKRAGIVRGSNNGDGLNLQNTVATVRKFRLAIITTAEFSELRGNTVDSTMTWIATAMARVNGIFLKELGVMFELIPQSDKLICLRGDISCEYLKNDLSIFDDAAAFMKSRGVRSHDYDIGHSFTIRMGGVSGLPSLCLDGVKHMGTSGYGTEVNPGDTFYLLLAHELGHQLGAPHSFRDCMKGPNYIHLDTAGAVEPGSGSTIMSYAGSCGENNLQMYVDPWFDSHSLVIMQEYLEWNPIARCGTAMPMATPRPVMHTADSCIVPKGNFVQLSGIVANKNDIGGDVFIAWDRVDTGYENFTNTSVARFAMREPSTRSLARFLPNMYILSFGLDRLEEIAPLDGGGDQQMLFRFIGRTSYDPSATVAQTFSADLAGTFGYKDVELTFSDSIEPLKIIASPTTMKAHDFVDINWTGASTMDMIEIRVAVNTMTQVSSPDFDKVVDDLDWVSMGSFPNTGSAQVQVPQLINLSSRPLNLMIGSGTTECSFFDLVPGIQYEDRTFQHFVDPLLPPSTSPTSVPSQGPSESPSKKSCKDTEHVCGYGRAVTGKIVPAYFSVCLYDSTRKMYTSMCLAQDDILALEYSGGLLNRMEQLASCGCCSSDASSHSFCGEPIHGCPMESFGGCALTGGQNVGVEVCMTNKRRRIQKKCQDPFEWLAGNEVLVGCGSNCSQPLNI